MLIPKTNKGGAKRPNDRTSLKKEGCDEPTGAIVQLREPTSPSFIYCSGMALVSLLGLPHSLLMNIRYV